jgi:hypothetical protein
MYDSIFVLSILTTGWLLAGILLWTFVVRFEAKKQAKLEGSQKSHPNQPDQTDQIEE